MLQRTRAPRFPNRSTIVQSVCASRPPGPDSITVILWRWWGWRPIGLRMLPLSSPGWPETSARYSFCTVRAANWAASPRWAASDLATRIRPEVSRSSRCTIPGRSTPPTPLRPPAQWASSACTRVFPPVPAPGWTIIPAALFRASRCLSSQTMSRGMALGTSSEAHDLRQRKLQDVAGGNRGLFRDRPAEAAHQTRVKRPLQRHPAVLWKGRGQHLVGADAALGRAER